MKKTDLPDVPATPTRLDASRSFSRGVLSILDGMASIMDFGQSTRLRRRMARRLDHDSPENWFGPKSASRPWP